MGMKAIVIEVPKLAKMILGYRGIMIFPFILIENKTFKRILRHEEIHFKQALECGVIFFYFIYVCHYLLNLIIYRSHKNAYKNIVFEHEALRFEHRLDYLEKHRRSYNWLRI